MELEKSIASPSLYDSLNGDVRNILLKESIGKVSDKIDEFLEGSKDIDLKVLCDIINGVDDIKVY